jgi:hypothetical protein
MSVAKEQAVRMYLQFLEDPLSAVDTTQLASLEAKMSETRDPVEKLKLMTAIDGLADMAGAAIRGRFVKHALSWATSHGVKAKSFAALGVPQSVLVDAGFLLAPSQPNLTAQTSERAAQAGAATSKNELDPEPPTLPAPSERAAASPSRKNRPAVFGEAVASAILNTKKKEVFTIRQITEKTGATPATVTKTLGVLVAKGVVISVGPLQLTEGRGKAPAGYQLTSTSS